MIISFDIFDTCLIRRCGEAQNVFFLLGRRLFGADTTAAEMFYHWRCWAEGEAVRVYGKKTVNLQEIYTVIRPEVKGEYTIEQLMSKEMQMESEQLRLLPSTSQIITAERKKGNDVVFISDMYLPSSFLLEVLVREGIATLEDKVIVSCEHSATKSTGELYHKAACIIGSLPHKHYGDNKWSDFRMAKKAGIKARQLHTEYSKVEKYLLEQTANLRDAQICSCIIGALRYARLTSSIDNIPADISADFVTPIWTAYVLACLNKAKKDNLDKLYFLARDGYILKYIAEQFQSDFPDMELRYLYVSRKSMFLPSLTSTKRVELEKYFGDGFRFTSDELMHRYFKQEEWDDKKVLDEAMEARKRIDVYFAQEGIYDADSHYALVDVGWKGSGRYAFNKLLQIHGLQEREMWYWGTFKDWRMNFSNSFWTYNTNQPLPIYFITLIEDYFSSSPDLSTVDYSIDHDSVVSPIFDEQSRIDNSEILSMNKYCLSSFVTFIREYDLLNNEVLDSISSLCSSAIINHPEFIDFSIFANMKSFSEIGTSDHWFKKVGVTYTIKYILGSNHNLGWADGNMAYTYPCMYPVLKNVREASLHLKCHIHSIL